MPQASKTAKKNFIGLNAANFFLAELSGVIGPFLAVFLRQKNWTYVEIGLATAFGGLGTFLLQAPAGYFVDLIRERKLMLSTMSILLGICFGLLPFFSKSVGLVFLLLFLAGAASAFFVPLLTSLALSLAGVKGFAPILGQNQSWNHAGNIAAALTALLAVKAFGVESVFFITFLISFLAVLSLGVVKTKKDVATTKTSSLRKALRFFHHRQVVLLLLSVMLFHMANAPVLPLLGLYLKHLGANDSQVAWTVLIAQSVMVPTAYFAAKYCEHWGRKPVFAFAFLVLPLRILLYASTKNPHTLMAIQALDGIGAGIYGVVIALVCSDLTDGKYGFNTLMGLMQTALAFGAFAGPLAQGFVTEHLGFRTTFFLLASIALLGAILFLGFTQETKK